MQCPQCASPRCKRNGGGRLWCPECRFSGDEPRGTEHFPPPAGHSVKGVSTLHDSDGNIRAQWVKTDAHRLQQEQVLQAVVDAAVAKLPPLKARPLVGSGRDDLLAVYPFGDMHIGMLAWAKETGGEDWDLDIAERVHCDAMATLAKIAPRAAQALIVDLGDSVHYDSMEPVTAKSGHILDADGRPAKMIAAWIAVMRSAIESALRRHDRVHVEVIPGNHNRLSSLWGAQALAQRYGAEPRVTISISPAPFRYYRHGKVLIGAHHGDTCKPDRLPGVMAADRAQDWGQTLHRYWLVGHFHHQAVKEHPGCTVEVFNTLAARDAYANAGGWRSRRNLKCLVMHAEHGEVARHIIHPGMLEHAA
jgi:hypothetical protein